MLTSIYIHIPFCNHICNYCDFHKSLATDKRKEAYINALIKELQYRKNDLVNIRTVYIGGGTPLSLSQSLLTKLLDTISQVVNTNNLLEYSIETNPNNVTAENVDLLLRYGVTRISIGVQTFNPVQLVFLGRDHKLGDVHRSITLLKEKGLHNINIDLMFSLIHQTIEDVQFDIQEFLKLDVPHISYYSLILEERTKLYQLYEQGKISMNSEDTEGMMYNIVMDVLQKNGYRHYEISNFAKPGYESQHNLTYWRSNEYLGFGSGAHSLYQGKRFYHQANTTKYIRMMEEGQFESHLEEPHSPLHDYLLMGLRLIDGLDLNEIKQRFHVSLLDRFPQLLQHQKDGLIDIQDNRIKLSKTGILLGNVVFSTFVEDES